MTGQVLSGEALRQRVMIERFGPLADLLAERKAKWVDPIGDARRHMLDVEVTEFDRLHGFGHEEQ